MLRGTFLTTNIRVGAPGGAWLRPLGVPGEQSRRRGRPGLTPALRGCTRPPASATEEGGQRAWADHVVRVGPGKVAGLPVFRWAPLCHLPRFTDRRAPPECRPRLAPVSRGGADKDSVCRPSTQVVGSPGGLCPPRWSPTVAGTGLVCTHPLRGEVCSPRRVSPRGSVPASTRLSVHWASTPFLCDQAPPAHAAGGQTPLWPHCQDGLPPRAPACTCHCRSWACVGRETQLTSRHVGPRQKTQGEGRDRGGGRRRASWRRRRAGGGAGAGFTGSACSRGPAGCSEEGRGYCALWTPSRGVTPAGSASESRGASLPPARVRAPAVVSHGFPRRSRTAPACAGPLLPRRVAGGWDMFALRRKALILAFASFHGVNAVPVAHCGHEVAEPGLETGSSGCRGC